MARKHEFLVVVPDKPNSHTKRIELGPIHLQRLIPLINSRTFKVGGAMLKDLVTDEDPNQLEFNGSSFICLVESREEVLKIVRDDVFTSSGVWDVEKIQIYPFKTLFMK